MINKKSIWFLTLFSLILVLSVYYVTMPSELLLSNNSDYMSKVENEDKTEVESPVVDIQESSLLVALRVEAERPERAWHGSEREPSTPSMVTSVSIEEVIHEIKF